MIDCLSNPEWIKPQIDFLLFLQNYRVGTLECFDKFFLSITILGEYWLPTLLSAVIYWCVDFRAGIYLFSLEGLNAIISHFFKMIACVYRPWVLDNNIHPSELAVPYAKGYSFPSGHSSMSSSVLGGLAYLVRSKKFLCIFFILLILLVGFSRLWLGVHTPQDVICGFLIGLTLIFGINPMIKWAEKNPNRYLYLLGIIDITVALCLVYTFMFNTYRIDYVNGEILVNPDKLKYLTIVIFGYALGLLNGCFLCRRFFPFNPKEVSIKRRITRGIIGSIFTVFLLKYILEEVIVHSTNITTSLPAMFFAGIMITLVYPIIFSKAKKFI